MKPFVNTIGKGITPNGSGKEKVYVPIFWGQSGMDGRVNLSNLPIDIPNPSDKVFNFWNGDWNPWEAGKQPVSFTNSTNYSHDTILLNRLADYLGANAYGVKLAKGGSGVKPIPAGVGDWHINSTGLDDLWLPLRQRILDVKAYVEITLNKEFVVPFIMMDIGETDSSYTDYPLATCKQDYKDLFAALRGLVGGTYIPIIHRELGLNQSGVQQFYIDMQNDFANGEVVNYNLIPNTGLTMFDGIHLDDASVNSVANQALELVKTLYPEPII